MDRTGLEPAFARFPTFGPVLLGIEPNCTTRKSDCCDGKMRPFYTLHIVYNYVFFWFPTTSCAYKKPDGGNMSLLQGLTTFIWNGWTTRTIVASSTPHQGLDLRCRLRSSRDPDQQIQFDTQRPTEHQQSTNSRYFESSYNLPTKKLIFRPTTLRTTVLCTPYIL